MNLESLKEKKTLLKLKQLISAELLFLQMDKAVFVLDGAGVNGPRARGCFEVSLRLDADGFEVLAADLHGVSYSAPGYIRLSGRNDPDQGALFYMLRNAWHAWWLRECERAVEDISDIEEMEMLMSEIPPHMRRAASRYG
ncbi:hypothetical protein [Acidithiobacillus ferrooxidans]|uniref:Uncharacterized protein n=1 Tax=Acidithiobacillus ferrooxidans TaxID=920 RepID=A0A2W1K636_ACIFR|nr:hypothetical protein [Acidithiobacillus ferrooxidans]MBU2816378.1 hypothetical protein [Acidithiobacillus ferrooxidans]MCR1344042.1 hypothetical protein [Acidithiobacillus ferrooxidans]PZD82418.1 hypothetical protein DN052_05215 [Acidithiobacillus ferrooxidans]QLK41308.1 hypothetical protein FE661_03350 [Acidithiobacillus ferrooxidans]QZT53250.1 hypothetical protein K7B00_03350 [Acidithiobacillus ferrooxidans]